MIVALFPIGLEQFGTQTLEIEVFGGPKFRAFALSFRCKKVNKNCISTNDFLKLFQ